MIPGVQGETKQSQAKEDGQNKICGVQNTQDRPTDNRPGTTDREKRGQDAQTKMQGGLGLGRAINAKKGQTRAINQCENQSKKSEEAKGTLTLT